MSTTHHSRLAKTVARRTGLGHQAALRLVRDWHDQRLLPEPLDAAGMSTASRLLIDAVTGVSAVSGAHSANSAGLLARIWPQLDPANPPADGVDLQMWDSDEMLVSGWQASVGNAALAAAGLVLERCALLDDPSCDDADATFTFELVPPVREPTGWAFTGGCACANQEEERNLPWRGQDWLRSLTAPRASTPPYAARRLVGLQFFTDDGPYDSWHNDPLPAAVAVGNFILSCAGYDNADDIEIANAPTGGRITISPYTACAS